MEIFIYCVLFVLALFSSRLKLKRWINFVSVFSMLWCFSGAISTMGLFSMRIPGNEVHQYAWTFVICVDIAYLATINSKREISDSLRNFKLDRIVILQTLTIILVVPLLVKMITVFFTSGSLTAIRNFYFSGEIFSSIYADLIFRQVPFGFLEGLIICYVYVGFINKKPKYILYAILNTLLATFISGGRYPAMLLVYSLLILLITEKKNNSKNKQEKKYDKKMKRILVFLMLFILFITLNRGQALIRTIVAYFSGSLSFLDYIISSPAQFGLNEKLFGYLILGAFIEPVVLILKVLGLSTAKVPQWYFNIYCQQFYNIGTVGEPIYFNNNTTIIYYILRDFGPIGIVFCGLAAGFVLARISNRGKKGDVFWQLIYIYACNVMFNSVMTYQFFGMTPVFVILLLFLFSSRLVKIRIKI